nr:uncharacterized protein LOC117281690 [Nicotiana tomentosiformis]
MITSFNDRNFAQTRSTNRYCAFCYRNFSLVCCEICFGLHPVFKLAADDSFIEFYLFVPRTHASFNLSPAILESRLLTVLHLKGYVFEEKNFEELPSLKEIYFDYVSISPTNLFKLISGCPSIVELTLKDCYNDKYCLSPISLPDMNELKKVHVSGTDIESIQIKARNLVEFHLFSSSESALKLDLHACSKLQVLKIDCEFIPIGFPKEISSAFPCLKCLFLRLCKRLKNIKLLSPELENLNLSNMVDLDDAIIVTPNLRSFKLINIEKVVSSCPVVGSSLMEVEIVLKHVHPINRFLQMRNFAENLGENLTFSLATNATESKEVRFDSGNHGSNIRPLRIKHVNLKILFSRVPRYGTLIDEFFSYFHPQTLLVGVSSEAHIKYNFIQVLLDELKGREKGCHKCYKCSNICWRYCLKCFKILGSTTITRQGAEISLEFQW